MEKEFRLSDKIPKGMKIGLTWDKTMGNQYTLIEDSLMRHPDATLGLPPGKHEFMRVNKKGEKYEVERYLGNESDVYVRGSSNVNNVLKRNENSESTGLKRVFFRGKGRYLSGYLGNLIENQDK